MTREQLKKHLEEIRDKIPAAPVSYPSTSQVIKNAVSSISQNLQQVISGNGIMVEASVADARLAICQKCDFFEKNNNRCKKCGCYMEIKTKLKVEKCPERKW